MPYLIGITLLASGTALLPSSNLYQTALSVYKIIALTLSSVVAIIFFIRLAYAQLTLEGSWHYRDLASDFIKYTVLIFLFPVLFSTLLSHTGKIANDIKQMAKINSVSAIKITPQKKTKLYGRYSDIEVATEGEFIAEDIENFSLLKSISEVIGGLFTQIQVFLLYMSLALAPLFILMGTLLNLGWGFKTYLTMIFLLACFPIFDATFNLVSIQYIKTTGESSIMMGFAIVLMKFISAGMMTVGGFFLSGMGANMARNFSSGSFDLGKWGLKQWRKRQNEGS